MEEARQFGDGKERESPPQRLCDSPFIRTMTDMGRANATTTGIAPFLHILRGGRRWELILTCHSHVLESVPGRFAVCSQPSRFLALLPVMSVSGAFCPCCNRYKQISSCL